MASNRRRVGGLVGLEWADQPKLEAGNGGPAFAPARLRFLHPVFAEQPLAGRQHRLDPLVRLLLRHRDQRNSLDAPGGAGGGGDAIEDAGAGGGDVGGDVHGLSERTSGAGAAAQLGLAHRRFRRCFSSPIPSGH